MAGPRYDGSYGAKNQRWQGGADEVVAGNLQIDKTAGGKLYVDGTEVTATGASLNADIGTPASATLTPAQGAANQTLVSIQLKDPDGVNITGPTSMDVYLSDAASGAGLTAVTASGAVAAGASGVDIATLVSKKALRVQTTAAGLYILAITDSAKTGFYVVAQIGGRKAQVSAQLVTGNYG